MINYLKETDDLDGDLFKGITKNNFSKTMPAQNKPASIMARNKSNKHILLELIQLK